MHAAWHKQHLREIELPWWAHPCTRHLKPTTAVEWISVAVYLITHRILHSTLGDVNGVLDVGGRACAGWFTPSYVETGRETASAGLFKTLFGWRKWKALVLVESINTRSTLQKVHWGILSTIAPGVLNLSAQCRIVPTLAWQGLLLYWAWIL